MSNTPKIDEIEKALLKYGIKYHYWVGSIIQSKEIDKITAEAKEAIYQLILEVIGEDAETMETEYALGRKELRQEQRQKLSDLFGKD